MRELLVTAAVIVRDGRLLIARRARGGKEGGRWELPGGKVRRGETLAACLARELGEELGIRARIGEVLCSTRRSAPGRTLELTALEVRDFDGEPEAREHDELAWTVPEEWARFDFLDPDVALLNCLRQRWAELGGREGGASGAR